MPAKKKTSQKKGTGPSDLPFLITASETEHVAEFRDLKDARGFAKRKCMSDPYVMFDVWDKRHGDGTRIEPRYMYDPERRKVEECSIL